MLRPYIIFGLNPEYHAVERVFPAAHDGERERDHHEHEFELPPGRVLFLELAMGLGPEERDRAEHHDDEAEGGELREEAEDEAEGSRGLGDREDAEVAQHACRHAVGRLGTPEAALGQAVQQEDGAERETEQEERDVTVLMERGEEAHGLLSERVRDGGRIYRAPKAWLGEVKRRRRAAAQPEARFN